MALAACAGLPRPATVQGHWMAGNWYTFWFTGAAIYAFTAALIVYSVARWRKRSDRPAVQLADNFLIEIVGVLIPLALVLGLFFMLTWPLENKVDRLVATPDVTVNVTAFRWSWQFAYPGHDIRILGTPTTEPQLVLPAGETVQINLSSIDVDHAFWIPAFLYKKDAIPGYVNRFDINPDRIGQYWGECAEFCGLQHARMHFTVRVLARDQFARWLASHGKLALR
ncbi:MAG: cytochrome c oxidase subunit II [Candidatus Eremiobacteraeota bacterium]|nr:cytochrome c oxidase subunit II [Candidatus Eremiobacteraeota bacterium]MBC5801796.1 cytochrome c oxidase subunit II [Candidatus Eremiobacteraeota bacterium]